MHSVRRPTGAAVIVLLFAQSLAGCVTKPPGWSLPLPEPPSETARANFGRMGVVLEDTHPGPSIKVPPGQASATGIGAGEGALFVVGAGASAGGLGLVVGVFLSPLGMLVGGVYGAAAAEDEGEVKAARERVVAAFRESGFEQRLVGEFVRRASIDAGREVLPLDVRWEHNPSPERLSAARAADLDCVLVLRIEALGLVAPVVEVNPSLDFACFTTARLVRLSDGAVLYELPLVWSSASRNSPLPNPREGATFLEWSADEASDLRRVLAEASAATAERIVEELFLLHVAPEEQLASQRTDEPHAPR